MEKILIWPVAQSTLLAGHTNAFILPVMDYWGGSQSALVQGGFEPPARRSTLEHANHQTTMTAPSHRINYTPGPQRGDLLPIWGIVCEDSPATCRPQGAGVE